MSIIRKYIRTGNGWKERLIIKSFKYAEDMYKFLNKQDNNNWAEIKKEYIEYYPEKSGVYAMVGGQWTNVKKLDPNILVHV